MCYEEIEGMILFVCRMCISYIRLVLSRRSKNWMDCESRGSSTLGCIIRPMIFKSISNMSVPNLYLFHLLNKVNTENVNQFGRHLGGPPPTGISTHFVMHPSSLHCFVYYRIIFLAK